MRDLVHLDPLLPRFFVQGLWAGARVGRSGADIGFRYRVPLPEERALQRAVLVMYAFHSCHAWVNEKPVGAAFHWEKTARLDVTDAMQAGENIIALLADQTDPHQPAIQGKLVMQFASGDDIEVRFDREGKASQDLAEGWKQSGFDDAAIATLSGGRREILWKFPM
jgi:hypothetical protein